MSCGCTKGKDLQYPSGIIAALHTGSLKGTSVSAVQMSLYCWNKNVPELERNIILYMPLTLENQTQANWDHTAIGFFNNQIIQANPDPNNAADLAGRVIQSWYKDNYAEMRSAAGSALASGFQSLASGDFTIPDNVKQGGEAGITRLISNKLGEGAEATLQGITKKVLNPYMTLVYSGQNFRTFSFEFKFTPKSERESQEIYDIIKELRKAQHPDSQGGQFLGYPKEIQIKYLHSLGAGESVSSKENKWLNKFKKCVINDISVNYTSAGHYAPMRNGFPAETTMTITFTENEMLNRCDIEEGY